MALSIDDPIAALATAEGPGPLALIRVSGTDCVAIVSRIVGATCEPMRPLRIELPWGSEPPVPAIAVAFSDGRSYTGESSIELYLPSSPPVVRGVLEVLRQAGVRSAEPGEFTRRAFLNGRMDLTRAEAVAQLIAAENDETARIVRQGLDGRFADAVRELADGIHELSALLEAGLDFSEQEVEPPDSAWLDERIGALESRITELLEQPAARIRETARVRVVIFGRANAGKSTLFNRLAGSPVAITAETPGTTRDPVTCTVEWEGLPAFELVDLAGARSGMDAVETAAQGLAARLLEDGDPILYLLDATRPVAELEEEWQALDGPLRARAWPLLNKWDSHRPDVERGFPRASRLSASTGMGVRDLVGRLRTHLGAGRFRSTGAGFLFTDRQRGRLGDCAAGLAEARETLAAGAVAPELLAVDLRRALDALREITGEITTEHTLDLIFARFCLGK